MTDQGPIATAVVNFYQLKQHAHHLRRVCVLLGVALLLSLSLNVAFTLKGDTVKVFAVDRGGYVRQLAVDDKPPTDDRARKAFAVNCILDAVSYNALAYATQASRAQECFSANAWDDFFKGFFDAGYWNLVVDRQATIIGSAVTAPLFVGSQLQKGIKVEEYHFEIQLTIETRNERSSSRFDVSVLLTEAEFRVNPRGFLIARATFAPAKSGQL